MKKDKEKTKVIFRLFKGEVVAIFPELPGALDENTCAMYAHCGQHGTCFSAELLIKNSKPATASAYKDLKGELEFFYGYNLKVMHRYVQAHARRRKLNLKKAREACEKKMAEEIINNN